MTTIERLDERMICEFYSINANWILETESNLFIQKKSSTQTVHKNTLKEAI
jgi:hypothetical protein